MKKGGATKRFEAVAPQAAKGQKLAH